MKLTLIYRISKQLIKEAPNCPNTQDKINNKRRANRTRLNYKKIIFKPSKKTNSGDDNEPPHNKQRVDDTQRSALDTLALASTPDKPKGEEELINKIIGFTAGAKKRFTLKKKRNVSSKKTKSAKYFY